MGRMTLAQRWEIEDNAFHRHSVFSRLYPVVYGGIIGSIYGAQDKTHPQSIAHITKLLELLCSKKHDEGFDAGLYLSPLLFLEPDNFDFSFMVDKVSRFSGTASNDVLLGHIIYMTYLFRLYHNDDYERALNITVELCEGNLAHSVYAVEFFRYRSIMDKKIRGIPATELSGTGDTAYVLEVAMWCCLNNRTFTDTIHASANFPKAAELIGHLAGTMAGLFYRLDGILDDLLESIPQKEDIDNLIDKYGKAFLL
jgi:ADP-ribosylglycohydrolase